jgi:8-oxo-dGTP diphosphatase
MLVQNIKVAVDAMVFAGKGEDLKLLLIKRKNNPYQGMWAIPGGFVEDDEELEAAAMRELEEETGLRVPAMQQLYTFGRVGRDTRFRTITITHYAFIEDATPVLGADDATEAQWLFVKDIKELAFDHLEMLEMAMEKVVSQR